MFISASFFSQTLFADPIFRVNHGTSQVINKFGTCKKITNSSASKDVMVPTNTSDEWSAFLAHLPTDVTAITCAPMIMTWNTNNTSTGSSTATQAMLPLVSGATYNFEVDWGDGNTNTITTYNDPNATHTYASAGTYTIKLTGTFSRLAFSNTGDRLKILDVTQWGSNAWISMTNMFYGCANLATFSATDAPDLSSATSTSYMLQGATTFNGDISSWNTGAVVSMNNMFYEASAFNQNLGSWDVSKVTDMSYIFSFTGAFNGNISSWNTGAVTDMSSAFQGASAFTQSLKCWNVTAVTNYTNYDTNATAWTNCNKPIPWQSPSCGQTCI